MRKVISRAVLAEAGWRGMCVGRHVVSFCSVCGVQRTHHCTGINGVLFRFDCDFCSDRLNGDVVYG